MTVEKGVTGHSRSLESTSSCLFQRQAQEVDSPTYLAHITTKKRNFAYPASDMYKQDFSMDVAAEED